MEDKNEAVREATRAKSDTKQLMNKLEVASAGDPDLYKKLKKAGLISNDTAERLDKHYELLGDEDVESVHDIMEKGVGVKPGENYVVGPWLTFDPKTEHHTGEFAAEANALLKDPNNKGFQVPEASKV